MANDEAPDGLLSEILSIMLVSTNQTYLEVMQSSLHQVWKEQIKRRPYSVKVHICQNLSILVEKTTPRVDYLVFLFDCAVMTSLSKAEPDLQLVLKTLSRHKILMVAIDINYTTAIKPPEFSTFGAVYQTNTLIGNLQHPDDQKNLSERILNMCENYCAITNGVPFRGVV